MADKSYPGDRQVAVIETPHANWFVLDSLDQTNVTPGKLGIHLLNIPTLAYVFSVGQPRGWVDARLRCNGMSLKLNALDHTHKLHGDTFDLAWR